MKIDRIATIRERLIEAMTRANKKQVDLVRETGLNRGTISRYISGEVEPKSNAIYKLAKSLNVSEAWLIGYDVPMERRKNIPQDNDGLSEGEKMMLELFRQIPEGQQEMVLEMIRVALKRK